MEKKDSLSKDDQGEDECEGGHVMSIRDHAAICPDLEHETGSGKDAKRLAQQYQPKSLSPHPIPVV